MENPTHVSLRIRFFWLWLIVLLIVGLVVGFFAGKYWLDYQWRHPTWVINEAHYQRSAIEGANPTPIAGTRVFRAIPLRKARVLANRYTEQDPLIAVVSGIGRDDEKVELGLTLKNKGTCTITKFEGVGYAFDAHGHPAPANKTGEHYFAFSADQQNIPPGEQTRYSTSIQHTTNASLVVTHVDSATCENGTTWHRK